MKLRKVLSARGAFSAALAVACMVLIQSAAQAQALTGSANPPSGVAGVNTSYVTGSGFPAGTITGAEAIFGVACAAPAAATAPATVTTIATLHRFGFEIPGSLTAGTYYVWVKGTAGSTAFNSLSTTPTGSGCSTISVSVTSTTLAACVPTSSLAVTVGTNVNAYVPFGAWEEATTGIEEVPLEGSGTAQNFATAYAANSCASNSATGEVVCTENNTNVDLINGSTLTTLTSGANTYADFTGGECENCGVGINASNNTAVIAMGLVGGGSTYYGGTDGVQVLNLSNNTFNTPVPLANGVSEDISIDPTHNLILSPAEDSNYDLLQIGSGNTLTEYGNSIGGNYLDSAAEDCTTGIALSSSEFTGNIYITDLTQAKFTAGSPGTWTAPGQFLSVTGTGDTSASCDSECDSGYAAGTSGISSAPGSNHLAVVTGEFGGSAYSALLLPSTSGSGTPTLADWAYVSQMPNTPDGNSFSAGYDPHTITAYTSPNTSKSYAVFADWGPATGDLTPNYLGVVDLACVLALPRNAGTNDVTAAAVSGTGPGTVTSCTRYVAIP